MNQRTLVLLAVSALAACHNEDGTRKRKKAIRDKEAAECPALENRPRTPLYQAAETIQLRTCTTAGFSGFLWLRRTHDNGENRAELVCTTLDGHLSEPLDPPPCNRMRIQNADCRELLKLRVECGLEGDGPIEARP